jgi:hypothetical protein
MPNTLIPIQTYTLSSTTSSVTFSNIPQNYNDLKIVMSARGTNASFLVGLNMFFNSNFTTGDYNTRRLYGSGSAVVNDSGNVFSVLITAATAASNTFGNTEIYVPNYSVSGVAKFARIDGVTENSTADAYQIISTRSWSGTAAVTSITFQDFYESGQFVSGSTFTLYGISNGVKAVGGTLTVAGGYAYHTFTSTGSFLPNQKIKGAEILCVAGGGGGGRDNFASGGSRRAGGGGAGGYRYAGSQTFNAGNSYTALVGSGGAGGSLDGTSGTDSVFANLTSTGGGYGAGTRVSDGGAGAGGNGGSGGGGDGGGISSPITNPAQGNAGGTNWYDGSSTFGGGGGGGAGAAGGSVSPGNGGIGSNSLTAWGSATGTGQLVGGMYYYAGGGGGGGGAAGSGGSGGGGTGGTSSSATSGTANTGGGGGGNRGANGAAGGSGLVIIRYPLS